MTNVFIDGSSGTTGLRIVDRLSERDDITLITLPETLRKDTDARREALNGADVAFLCLPDAAAIEAVKLVENPHTVVIDTSTAHRVSPDFTYGFPEMADLREKIAASHRIANPGCHASGFIALVAPLVEKNLLKKDAFLSCFSLTGYSGGGKKMIAEYESDEKDALLSAPRQYGLSQAHKHLPEMQKLCNLTVPPVFCPVVADYYSGMEVTVSVSSNDAAALDELCGCYKEYYAKGLVHFTEQADENGFLSAAKLSGRDDMELSVYGNDERILLVSRFDNLGKGASGAAIQNMNLALGLAEEKGLVIG